MLSTAATMFVRRFINCPRLAVSLSHVTALSFTHSTGSLLVAGSKLVAAQMPSTICLAWSGGDAFPVLPHLEIIFPFAPPRLCVERIRFHFVWFVWFAVESSVFSFPHFSFLLVSATPSGEETADVFPDGNAPARTAPPILPAVEPGSRSVGSVPLPCADLGVRFVPFSCAFVFMLAVFFPGRPCGAALEHGRAVHLRAP